MNAKSSGKEQDRRFVEEVLALLSPLGVPSSRAMFGGYGIYLDGLMIGLIADRTLYFKVDDQTRPEFEAAGCEPFRYHKAGRKEPIVMSYHQAPPEIFESPLSAEKWGRLAQQAAQRAKK